MLFASLIHNKRHFLFSTVHLTQPIKLSRNHIWNIQYISSCQQIVLYFFPITIRPRTKFMSSFLIWGRDDKKRAALKQDLGAARLTFKNLYLFPLFILQHITFLPNLMFDSRRQRFCCWSFIIAVFVLFPIHSLNKLY